MQDSVGVILIPVCFLGDVRAMSIDRKHLVKLAQLLLDVAQCVIL